MPINALILFTAVALSPAPHGQGPSDWRKSSITPQAFAKNIDTHLFNLKDAYGKGEYFCQVPWSKEARAIATIEARIRDRKTFRIDSIKVKPNARDAFVGKTLIGNRGRLAIWDTTYGDFLFLSPGKDPGFGARDGMLQGWVMGMQQIIFQSYFTGKGVFQRLIAELTRPGSGYTVLVHERTIQGDGQRIPQIRIYAARTPAFAKKYGKTTFEIVSDSRLWIPLQSRVTEAWKGASSLYEWTMNWNGPEKFPESYYQLPKK